MRPLEGIRVLDLSRLLPGPYCTMLLADLGAQVIKIETPGLGDYMRLIPPFITNPTTGETIGAAYLMVNRNKQSVALNFRNARGKEILLQLARDADVVIETFRPDAANRWGIGYEAMRRVNPRIVYCSLSGYGQSGPFKDRAGHDLNYMALTGLLAANGAAGGPPVPFGVQVADLGGGMLAAIGILAALLGRDKSGEGQFLDIGLFDAAMSWAGTMAGATHVAGNPVERGKMQLNGGMACYNVYETSDGKFITLGAIEGHFWSAICKVLEREDLSSMAYEADAIPDVAAVIKTRTLDEWLERFKAADACVEPVKDFADVFSNPQVRHRGLINEMEIPGIGKIPQVGSVFVFSGGTPTPPPQLGQHTRAILTGAGMNEEELGKLDEAGVIRILDL